MDKSTRGAEAMEEALGLLAKTGPEYAGRLANHGPMAAEALVVLGRPDAVVPWVEAYRRRLYEHPAGGQPDRSEGVARGARQGRAASATGSCSSTGRSRSVRGRTCSPNGCRASRPE